MTCFRLIDAKKAQHPVALLCEVLGVSRAGFCAWRKRPASAWRRRDFELLDAIRAIHSESKATYGWPRVHAELRHRGLHASRERVARLMRQAGLSGMVRRRQGRTTVSLPGIATALDLVRRDFAPAAPNRLWVADLTEIATWEGKLYLAVVVDCCSRRCVGWAMAERMRAELVVDALQMALWQRRPDLGLVHHSDRGGQLECKRSLQHRALVRERVRALDQVVDDLIVWVSEPRSGEAGPAIAESSVLRRPEGEELVPRCGVERRV